MPRVAVINLVGLTESLLGPSTPHLNAFARAGGLRRIEPAFPAVTCTAQANYLTGLRPTQHGIVGNGWYARDLAEVQFWKQSNHLVQARKVWEDLRAGQPGFTCANLFWWFNMYSSVDYSITPRPIYPADGRKILDIYSWPYSIRSEIKSDLGEFPFATFWGPAAGIPSPLGPPDAATRWIAEAARWIEQKYQPTLSLIYLPHLDYNLQRLGPHHPGTTEDVAAADRIAGQLIDFFRARDVRPLLLSEYGVLPVHTPVHLNRLFREQGWLVIKEELGLEMLDAGASRVFAVADHQVAHIYLNDGSLGEAVRELVEGQAGVARVLGSKEKAQVGLDHERAGDLVAVAQEEAWFTYYYWRENALAPDFARCVDIHRKPGYDPVELFVDPELRFPRAQILWRLLRKKLGFRTLLDIVSLDATLVKGSHGVCPAEGRAWPLLLTEEARGAQAEPLSSTAVYEVIKEKVQKN